MSQVKLWRTHWQAIPLITCNCDTAALINLTFSTCLLYESWISAWHTTRWCCTMSNAHNRGKSYLLVHCASMYICRGKFKREHMMCWCHIKCHANLSHNCCMICIYTKYSCNNLAPFGSETTQDLAEIVIFPLEQLMETKLGRFQACCKHLDYFTSYEIQRYQPSQSGVGVW